jgi:hypothetical protein
MSFAGTLSEVHEKIEAQMKKMGVIMAFDAGARRRRQIWSAATAVFLLVTTSSIAVPAHAEDGDGIMNSVLSFVGLQPDKEKQDIDYRARPPLVVPPQRTLPAPIPAGANRGPQWPADPGAIARRRAEADSNRPAPQITPNTQVRLSPTEMMQGRAGEPDADTRTNDCSATAGTPSCTYTAWDKLKEKFTGNDKELVVSGVEPPREYLTEPPVGYRRPTQTVKATPAPVQTGPTMNNAPDASNPGDYARQNSKHKYSVDE